MPAPRLPFLLCAAALVPPAASLAAPAREATRALPSIAAKVSGMGPHDGFLPLYWDARHEVGAPGLAY